MMGTFSSYCIRVLKACLVRWDWCLAARCGSLWREDEETPRWDVTGTVVRTKSGMGMLTLRRSLETNRANTSDHSDSDMRWGNNSHAIPPFASQVPKKQNVSCRPSCKMASKGLLLHLRTHAAKHKEKPSVSDSIDGIGTSIGENPSFFSHWWQEHTPPCHILFPLDFQLCI